MPCAHDNVIFPENATLLSDALFNGRRCHFCLQGRLICALNPGKDFFFFLRGKKILKEDNAVYVFVAIMQAAVNNPDAVRGSDRRMPPCKPAPPLFVFCSRWPLLSEIGQRFTAPGGVRTGNGVSRGALSCELTYGEVINGTSKKLKDGYCSGGINGNDWKGALSSLWCLYLRCGAFVTVYLRGLSKAVWNDSMRPAVVLPSTRAWMSVESEFLCSGADTKS